MVRQMEGTAVASSWRSEDDEDEFLVALLASARDIAGAQRVADALPRIAEGAAAVVPDVRDAGVAVRSRGGMLACAAHTTETAARVDGAQIRMGEGPCIDAVAGADIVVLPDAVTETRWPRFVREAAGHGVRASLSVRLTERLPGGRPEPPRHAAGSRRPDGAGAGRAARPDVRRVRLDRPRRDRPGGEPREGARLAGRDRAGQGHPDAPVRRGPDEAFARLRRASQTTNTKLHDVAAWVAASRRP